MMSVRSVGTGHRTGRRTVSAGLAAALVAAAGVAALPPVAIAPTPALAAPAVQLSALAASLPSPAAAAPTPPVIAIPSAGGSAGNSIINAYNAIEPWAQYGVELGAWAVGWLPWPISLVAPQMNIAYNGIEPLIQASVYSLAYLIDGQTSLIGPTLTNGVQTGVNNFVQGEIAWFASFFPPLPPINVPVFPGAATTVERSATSTPRVAAAVAAEPPVGTVPAAQLPAALVDPPVPPASRTPKAAPAPAPVVAPETVAAPEVTVAATVSEPEVVAAETVTTPDVASSATVLDAEPSARGAEPPGTSPTPVARGHRGAAEGAKSSPAAAASVKPARSGRA